MNKRIKELAKQADVYERKLGKGIGMSRDEIFAELIVRDVVATVIRTQVTSPDFEWVILNNYDLEVK